MFKVNDRIRFVPDATDPLSFAEFRGKVGTVVGVDDQVDSPYPYTIRFDFRKNTWPVKATELEAL